MPMPEADLGSMGYIAEGLCKCTESAIAPCMVEPERSPCCWLSSVRGYAFPNAHASSLPHLVPYVFAGHITGFHSDGYSESAHFTFDSALPSATMDLRGIGDSMEMGSMEMSMMTYDDAGLGTMGGGEYTTDITMSPAATAVGTLSSIDYGVPCLLGSGAGFFTSMLTSATRFGPT
jgi:hypothetical protein